MGGLFELRGELTKNQSLILGIIGVLLLISLWWVIAENMSDYKHVDAEYNSDLSGKTDAQRDSIQLADSLRIVQLKNSGQLDSVKIYPILPPPGRVLASYSKLVNQDRLVYHSVRSIWTNIQGYVWATFLSILLGFLIGLIPFFDGILNGQVNAIRYLPLSALVGLFSSWFGLGSGMKVAFLAFGIFVYLLPIVVQRVREVKDVYVKTVYTLNANDWQTIWSVYFPSVMANLIDDIRVLTAISWTYIILAEGYNRESGLGNLIWVSSKQGRLHEVFAILIIIIIIGFIQDLIFRLLDRKLFAHKNYKSLLPGLKESKIGAYVCLSVLFLVVIINAVIGLPELPLFSSGFNISTVFLLFLIVGVLFMVYGMWLTFINTRRTTQDVH